MTDGYHSQIYKIAPCGTATVFTSDPRFGGKQGAIGLTGLDYHPSGFIIAVNHYGLLFKVPLNQPNQATGIQLPSPIVDARSINFLSNGNILVVLSSGVVELSSVDDWKTASIVNEVKSSFFGSAAATVRNGKVYLVQTEANQIEELSL